MRSSPPLPILLPALLIAASCAGEPPRGEPSLAEIRAAVERYRDVEAAIGEGYVRDPLDTCETAAHLGEPAEAGVMGIHYLRPDLLEIAEDETRLDVRGAHTDFLHPAVLLYEPQEDGSLELLGVENLVSAAAWAAAGHRQPPSLHGVPFHHTPADPRRSIEAHYDRHIWLFRENPSGAFAQYNPDATCRHHVLIMPMFHPEAEMDGHRHAGEDHTEPT
jgi:hypothetical protein